MEKISLAQMSTTLGGGLGDFIDGVCTATTAGSVGVAAAKFIFKRAISLNPVGAGIVLGIDAACVAYSIYNH